MTTATMDPELDLEAERQEGPPVIRVETIAELQDLKLSKAQNGANFDITFEIPVDAFAELADSGDGHDVTFKQIEIGSGAAVRRAAMSRDADGGKHVKISVRFSQSEIRKSAGRLATLIGNDDTRGKLVFEPMQTTLDLTTRAE